MNKSYTPVKIWLYILVFMVFSMVFIGGITRLTDSGLSMVDWRPIMGAIPPLNETQWQETFNQYKLFPEYQKINKGMSLSQFKQIFFWEYFHRLFGRLVGLVFLIPFLYFLKKRYIHGAMIKKYSFAFILGGLQGLMGWYMVKSGLVNRPDVSHFRLAAHLLLAFAIIAYLYWLILELNYSKKVRQKKSKLFSLNLSYGTLLIIQFSFGAFVAGLDAGLTHNTFPKMGRSWIPSEVFSQTLVEYLYNPVFIQFTHRVVGFVLLGLALVLFLKSKKSESFLQKKNLRVLSAFTFLQFVIGVATLLMYVPISVASLHQIFGCLLLLIYTRSLYFTVRD